MKIGLLTFHNAANYGAALQAFALQKVLLDNGIDCEYINYQNDFRKTAYNMTYHLLMSIKNRDVKGAIKHFIGFPFMKLRKIRFIFFKKNLICSTRIYSSSQQAVELNQIYFKFIVGSDQVWNYKNNGNDDAYLLSFVKDDSKKISYSSSFGTSEIPEALIEIYKHYLSRIAHLSVREKHGINLVFKLTNRVANLVLDPVFLISKEYWEHMSHPKKGKKEFIFSYTNKPKQLESFLSSTCYDLQNVYLYKLSGNLKISDFLDLKTRVKYSMSPIEFISVIRDANLIVSASFHCIALSIIMNKQFVVILTGDKGKDERLLNILNLFGLENRIYTKNMSLDHVNQHIDYVTVNKKIDRFKSSSMSFLLNAIYN